MIKHLKDLFAYTRSERNGIFVLIAILLSIILFNIVFPYFLSDKAVCFEQFGNEIVDFEMRQKHVADSIQHTSDQTIAANKPIIPFQFDPNNLPDEKWRALGFKNWQINTIKNYEKKGGKFNQASDLAKIYCISKDEYEFLKPYIVIKNKEDSITPKIYPFVFDPNEISHKKWLDMGINEKVVQTIMNYRKKGGRFKNKEELKKIYGLGEAIFESLEPYITINDTITKNYHNNREKVIVEINSADSLDLQQLTGIGPAFAKRIINYRQLLGGYYHKKQILEVYGMDTVRYKRLVSNISVDRQMIKRININTATIKELIRHPYIEYYLARSLINIRNKNGPYEDLEQVKGSQFIPEEIYQKIEPYLTVQ